MTEPQLKPIDLLKPLKDSDKRLVDVLDRVIQGEEFGPRRRPFNTDWGRTVRDVCKENGVPYFFKQIDKIKPIPPALMFREFPRL